MRKAHYPGSSWGQACRRGHIVHHHSVGSARLDKERPEAGRTLAVGAISADLRDARDEAEPASLRVNSTAAPPFLSAGKEAKSRELWRCLWGAVVVAHSPQDSVDASVYTNT